MPKIGIIVTLAALSIAILVLVGTYRFTPRIWAWLIKPRPAEEAALIFAVVLGIPLLIFIGQGVEFWLQWFGLIEVSK